MAPATFAGVDNIEISYEQWGPPATAEAPTVLLHHGFAANTHVNWVVPGIVGELVAAGRNVVGIDARGHGRSAKPHDPAFYGESKMAADVSLLIDELGASSVDLVGYSMGGVVAAIAGSQEPRIRRLIIGGIGGGVVAMGGLDTRAVARHDLREVLLTADPASITDPGIRAFRTFADAMGADVLALVAQVEAAHRTGIALDRITAPTLVLAGDRDILAAHPEKLARAIPGAELRLVSGDHLSVVAAPEFADAIVAFLVR